MKSTGRPLATARSSVGTSPATLTKYAAAAGAGTEPLSAMAAPCARVASKVSVAGIGGTVSSDVGVGGCADGSESDDGSAFGSMKGVSGNCCDDASDALLEGTSR